MTDTDESISQINITGPAIVSNSPSAVTILSSLNATSHLNVYEYELGRVVVVGRKQYMTINSSQIYFQHCRLSSGSCIDRPLVAVDAST